MKNIFFTSIILLLSNVLFAEEPLPPGSGSTGTIKALVVVSEFPDDSLDYGDGTMPGMYDSIIAPSWSQWNQGQYRWSVTNYYGVGSWLGLKMYGDVNPYMNGKYVVAPHPLSWYMDTTRYPSNISRDRGLEADLIGILDSAGVDFSDYDNDNDGNVDFTFFFLPRNPNEFQGPNDHANCGFIKNDDPKVSTNDGVYVWARAHLGATHSYYLKGQTDDTICVPVCVSAIVHELGHNLEGVNIDYFFDRLSLPDRYEQALESNPYANSAVIGNYSSMITGHFRPHAPLYSPWERIELDWIKPTVIDSNAQNKILRDFNSMIQNQSDWDYMLYEIPVDSVYIETDGYGEGFMREYFLVSNYQHYSHWVDYLGWSYPSWVNHPDTFRGSPDSEAKGVLVWHINELFWNSQNQASEFMKFEDLECAEGLWNLDGTGPSPWKTEAGWDRLDRWCWINQYFAPGWDSIHNASTSHRNDFFRPDYKNAFHTLTNPTSDGYNMRGPATYTYPGLTWEGTTYPAAPEFMYLQNLPTHVSLEGIHYDEGTNMKLCIRRSRIWTDEQMAMDRTTQRKFICDSDDTFHFIYPLRGHIYYTKTYDPSKIWFKAEMVGPDRIHYDTTGYGVWPALALDKDNLAMAVFFDTSCSKVLYSYRLETTDTLRVFDGSLDTITDTLWKYPLDTLKLSGVPGPVAIEYGCGSNTVVNPGGITTQKIMTEGTEGSVHLAYITSDNGQDKLCYAHYYKTDPANLAEEILDTAFTEGTRILGASIEVDSQYNRVYIAYGCVKGDTAACYYLTKTDTGWIGPYKFTSSKSDTANEPLVPFLNIEGNYVTAVFNANDNVYATTKLRSNDYGFTGTSQISNISGRNRYPQVGGNTVTWTCYVTDDSSNVYKRTLPSGTTTRFDAAYEGKSYFAQVTKTSSGSAQLYQHGVFSGPKWAIYNGSGGNQENEGKPVPFTPPEGFKMSIPNNILVGSRLSIFTTGGDCRILVYDITGRQIVCQDIKDVSKLARIETPVDCDGWAKGVYFVRAVPKDGKVATSKVVLVK